MAYRYGVANERARLKGVKRKRAGRERVEGKTGWRRRA